MNDRDLMNNINAVSGADERRTPTEHQRALAQELAIAFDADVEETRKKAEERAALVEATFQAALVDIAERVARQRKKACKIVHRACIAVMDHNPDVPVKAITWEQFTPYYNDGDPCSFRVCEFGANISKSQGCDPSTSCMKRLWNDLSLLKKTLTSEFLYATFGDHAQVVVTRKIITVTSYEEHR